MAYKGIVGVLVASSLFVSSTGAVAATSLPSAPVSATQISPWAALSAMSGGASAAALCGAAAVTAAAQAGNGCVLPALDTPAAPVAQSGPPPQPIPVPPVEAPGGYGLGMDPLMLALGVLAAGALAFFLLRHHHNNNGNSPA